MHAAMTMVNKENGGNCRLGGRPLPFEYWRQMETIEFGSPLQMWQIKEANKDFNSNQSTSSRVIQPVKIKIKPSEFGCWMDGINVFEFWTLNKFSQWCLHTGYAWDRMQMRW